MAPPPRLRTLKPRLGVLDLRTALPPAKVADPHYQSPEHLAWRADVLRRAQGRCKECGRTGTRLFADHIQELRDGGAALDRNNGQALCGSCHTAKTIAARTARHARPT